MLELRVLELYDEEKCRMVIDRDGTILRYEFVWHDLPEEIYWDLIDYEEVPSNTPWPGARGAIYIPAIYHLEHFIRELVKGHEVKLPIDLQALGPPRPVLY